MFCSRHFCSIWSSDGIGVDVGVLTDGDGEGILTETLASVGVAATVAVCGTGVTPEVAVGKGGAVGVAVSVAATVEGTGVTPDVAEGKGVAVSVAVGEGTSFTPGLFVGVGYGCRRGVPVAVAVGISSVARDTEGVGSGIGRITRTQADKTRLTNIDARIPLCLPLLLSVGANRNPLIHRTAFAGTAQADRGERRKWLCVVGH